MPRWRITTHEVDHLNSAKPSIAPTTVPVDRAKSSTYQTRSHPDRYCSPYCSLHRGYPPTTSLSICSRNIYYGYPKRYRCRCTGGVSMKSFVVFLTSSVPRSSTEVVTRLRRSAPCALQEPNAGIPTRLDLSTALEEQIHNYQPIFRSMQDRFHTLVDLVWRQYTPPTHVR